MYTTLYVILFMLIWFIVGCIVCVFCDNENQDLLHWAEAFPFGATLGVFLVAMAFPAVVYFTIKYGR